jgi:hypothetical protein
VTLTDYAMLSTNGVLYAPGAALVLSGNSNLSAPIIVDALALSDSADPSPTLPSRPTTFVDAPTGDADTSLIGGIGEASFKSASEGELIRVGASSQSRDQAALDYVLARWNLNQGGDLPDADVLSLAGRRANVRRAL